MKDSLKGQILEIAKSAKQASFELALSSKQERRDCILTMADALLENKAIILNENKKDIEKAGQDTKTEAFIDRLTLNEERLKKMSESLKSIAGLNDSMGEVIKAHKVASGLEIKKVRVPIGVVSIIYESRPDVTSDCLGLCLKSANALILRGGSAAINSNIAIFNILKDVIKKCGLAHDGYQLVKNTDRKSIDILLKMNNYIDLVIPRGGEALINEVTKKSTIPVIKHYKGICTVYVDVAANLDMAYKICLNAKVERPGVCNAMETLLVHKKIAAIFLPKMLELFFQEKVEVRGTASVRKFNSKVIKAKRGDFQTEFLDLILAVRIVDGLDEAIEHINTFGSHHSDSIVTEDQIAARKFLQQVDSACVFLNTSTRFSDGYQFGMGAEMGISTDKIHARGPMAVEELTTYKYQIIGNGQIRE
ncbi:MAG: glutamate-5-semialdehyde dehydrogenase [Candidatus Omnitrophica bacterium]|nr:glutamate-5-semialdehyde dehydrogenase [Candidatus Omnitrophota bacterium]